MRKQLVASALAAALALTLAIPARASDWLAIFPSQTAANNAAKFVVKWWDTNANDWKTGGGTPKDPTDPPFAAVKITGWMVPPCTAGTDAFGNPTQTCTPKAGVQYLIRVFADAAFIASLMPGTATVATTADPVTGVVTTKITLTNGATLTSPPPADTPMSYM